MQEYYKEYRPSSSYYKKAIFLFIAVSIISLPEFSKFGIWSIIAIGTFLVVGLYNLIDLIKVRKIVLYADSLEIFYFGGWRRCYARSDISGIGPCLELFTFMIGEHLAVFAKGRNSILCKIPGDIGRDETWREWFSAIANDEVQDSGLRNRSEILDDPIAARLICE